MRGCIGPHGGSTSVSHPALGSYMLTARNKRGKYGRSTMAAKQYWKITGYDGTEQTFERLLPLSSLNESQVIALMQRLAAKHLDEDHEHDKRVIRWEYLNKDQRDDLRKRVNSDALELGAIIKFWMTISKLEYWKGLNVK